jgi:hypothetical protein
VGNYRIATILPSESKTAAGTKIIDILDRDVISRIDIKYNVTRTTHTMSAHPAIDISKIELVDGSEILASLNGYECQALNIYNRRCPSMNHGQHYAGNGEVSLYGLDFGRKLWDPVLAFDPKKFKNPQLKITYALTGCDAGGAAATLEVLGYFFDEKPVSPMGMLVAKEHYSWTPVASAYDHVLLPQDMPIRKMLIRAFQSGYEPWYTISNVRIDEGNVKKIPFEMDIETYFRFMKGQWSLVEEMLVSAGATSGRAVYVTPTQYYLLLGATLSTATTTVYTATWNRGGLMTLYTTNANDPIAGVVTGWLPNHCIEFPFGNPDDPDDWYDVAKVGSPRVRTAGGSSTSGGTGQILLEQLKTY